MAKYVFPAVLTPEEDGQFSVSFPDVKNCFTGGESLADALEMGKDALCLMLYDMEQSGQEIPAPSKINDVQHEENELVTLITCDTVEYRKFYDNRAVKKTLSIPSWLNDLAVRKNINFSAVLQEALKAKLNVK